MALTDETLQKIIDNDSDIHSVVLLPENRASPLFLNALNAISKNTFLRSISIYVAKLDLEELRALSISLKINTSIRSIAVITLNKGDPSQVTDDDELISQKIAHLSESIQLTKLETLSLKLKEVHDLKVAEQIAQMISSSGSIKTIRIVFALQEKVLDIIISALFNCKSLESIELEKQRFNVSQLELIGQLINSRAHISSLRLDLVYFLDPSLLIEPLKTNQSLQAIDFSGAFDGPIAAAELLRAGSKIRSLTLQGCSVEGNPFLEFFLALKENETIEILDIKDNLLNNNEVGALSDVIKTHPCIKSIKLDPPEASLPNYVGLMSALGHNSTLEFLALTRDSASPLLAGVIRGNKKLKTVEAEISTDDAETAEALRTNTTLESCSITIRELSDKELPLLEVLLGAPSLKELILRDSLISNKGFRLLATYLRENNYLNKLHFSLHESSKKTWIYDAEAILQTIRMNPTLTYVDLQNTEIEDEDLKIIQRELQNNIALNLCDAFISNFNQALMQTDFDAKLSALEFFLDKPQGVYREAYRLFVGLKYMSCESNEEASLYLWEAYSYSPLQEVAQCAMAVMFSLDMSAEFKTTLSPEENNARLLYILHAVGRSKNLEIQEFAYIALFQLMYPDKIMNPDDALTIKTIAIVNFSDIQSIAKLAIRALEAKSLSDHYERKFLSLIVKSPHHYSLIKLYSELPIFISLFKEHYPDKLAFICIEDCLSLAPYKAITDLVIAFPSSPPTVVETAESRVQSIRKTLSLRFFGATAQQVSDSAINSEIVEAGNALSAHSNPI